ncbi:Protein cueball [Nesidiocoris tenuis]|uniref:Protein cueball n=1 Tax=Nesidiocoris tenuis TaxID=355587 RepID=A0ABN7BEX7_9HEMI|nr:Protein cueball [Nesidiocoris tenuis]
MNLAVSEYDFLDFLYQDGRNVSVLQGTHRGVNSLVYDPIYENLYFSDTSDPDVTHIKMMEVTRDAVVSRPYSIISFNSSNLFIHDLAHDPVTSSLFWTTTDIPNTGGRLWRATLTMRPIAFRPVQELPAQTPKGVAVDSCQGYVYWTNLNQSSPSIRRMRMNDSSQEIFISQNLGHTIFAPAGLTISQSDRMLYWVDEEDYTFFISRASLDSGIPEKFVVLQDGHEPNSLAVASNALYFTETDLDSVFVVPLSDPSKPIRLNHTIYKPQGIAVRNQLDFLKNGQATCPNLGELKKQVPSRKNITICLFGHVSPPVNGIECTCSPGYTGIHCEINVCHNYCLQGEQCYLIKGQPTCKCSPNRTGPRCEMESCSGSCLNGGTLQCNSSSQLMPICLCPDGFYGPSCETPSALCGLYCHYGEQVSVPNAFHCPCSSGDEPILPPRYIVHVTASLVAAVTLIVILLAALAIQTKRLKSRPRIFKRYSVTPKPVTSPSCEIAIENCCNMNICDTPCYEPDLRTLVSDRRKSKKEEKRGLLSEDVLGQQSSSCRNLPNF